MSDTLNTMIEDFWQARERGEYFPAAYFDRLTQEQAYQVQLAVVDRRGDRGEYQLGWKVGLTSAAIQQQFGCHEPVFGCILSNVSSGHVFSASELIAPGCESELCMRIDRDLPADVTVDEVRKAISVVYPSLEIIETRGPFTAQLSLALADNAQQKTIVMGQATALPRSLELVEAKVVINDVEVATGLGTAVLGNPLNSIVWLARKLAEFGRGLKAGEIVMTGSFTRQFPLAAGDRVRVSFSGIGDVETTVTV
jgi:2-keto-4-pentenoate hydratase